MAYNLIDGLNEAQKAAVVAPLENVLVLAGAGSGKTRVLVSRIAFLIDSLNISSQEILAVTFTNKAAKEMKTRLNSILNTSINSMWVGTFHGICHRILRMHHKDANLPELFYILDSDDQARIIKRVINTLGLDTEQWPVKAVQSFINGKKDEGLRAKHIFTKAGDRNQILVKIYSEYERNCEQAGVIDFAEILLRTHELLRDNKSLLQHYQARFKAILVDEFQDTNTIQYAWIKLLAGDSAFVMTVGDDDQSIYGWRGAKVENITKFSKDFQNVNIIRLEQNYRSTATILKAANILITNNQLRMGKNLWTRGDSGDPIVLFSAFNELEEARFLTERILQEERSGRNLNDIAVLYRSNAQSRVIEEAFLQTGIAYKIHGGMRFYERAEIKDAISYLRLLVNRHDSEAFERVVNFPTRGIGEKTMESLREFAVKQEISLWQAAVEVLSLGKLTKRAADSLNNFLIIINTLEQEASFIELDEKIDLIIQKSSLYGHFSKSRDSLAEIKLQNLKELVNAAKEFRYAERNDDTLPSVTAFLAHVSLESGEMQAEEHEQHVHMMTIHAAKGLEFPVVFLVGMEEGIFPSMQARGDSDKLEEERRLCYVAMTRAMQKLILTYAEIRRQYGREEYHRPSRFLRELPAELIDEVRAGSKANLSSASVQNDTGINLGIVVKHTKFGNGVVLATEGSGPNARVQVNFSEYGTKWLVLAYANLEI